jgi:hypothetical protein
VIKNRLRNEGKEKFIDQSERHQDKNPIKQNFAVKNPREKIKNFDVINLFSIELHNN